MISVVKNKKKNPFDGLKNINKKEYARANFIDLLDIVEVNAPSYQEGQTRDMFLFLYFINILVNADVDFIVNGGILLNIVLKNHCRRTHDIDVIVKDPDKFYTDVKNVLGNNKDINFEVKYEKKKEANEWYYKNTFAFRVRAYHNQETIGVFIIDGAYVDYYDKINKIKYYGPKIIDKDFCFYGVDIEYIVSDKILAVSSELPRPVKHLVDLYSLTKIELNIDKIKAFLKKGLERENVFRKKLGRPELNEDYQIKDNKQFLGHYVYEVISSGYKLSFKEIKDKVNAWIKTVIQA